MREEKRWRYYCDYCGKSGGSKHHMRQHETACTNNPGRLCGMCGRHGNTGELLDAARGGLETLKAAAQSCPACILVGVRAFGREIDAAAARNESPEVLSEVSTTMLELREWDFRDARDAWWATANRTRSFMEAF